MKSYQRIEIIKSNQGMVLIKSNQDIQYWHMAICSVIIDDKTLNHESQDNQSCWLHMVILFEA